jgi:hypothetical protein
MLIFGDPIIDGSALWKIVVAALIGGCGIVIVYGFLLLGLKFAGVGDETGATETSTSRVVGYAVAGICAILVVGVIVLGIYAMTQKS